MRSIYTSQRRGAQQMRLAVLSEVGAFCCQLILICHVQIYSCYEEEGIDQTCDLGNVGV